MNKGHTPWIEKGYSIFSNEGPSGLKVESLARSVGKNKSSFYHHFADMEVFIQALLDYHLEQAKDIAVKESACRSKAEFIDIILEAKEDLLFNRQLRIHRDNKAFEACFCKTNEISTPAMLPIWAIILDLKENSYLAGLVLQLSLQNFFLQITDQTLTKEWLYSYFDELEHLVKTFRKAGKVTSLDGAV